MAEEGEFAMAEEGGPSVPPAGPSKQYKRPDHLPKVEPNDDGELLCWICYESATREEVIRPCTCAEYVHPKCLETWRFSHIHPTAHYQCSNCHFMYLTVPSTDQTKWEDARRELKRKFTRHLLIFWLTVFSLILAVSLTIGGLSYAVDRNKNIPMMVKFTFMTIFSDFDNITETSMKEHREEMKDHFKESDVKVWPYYLGFGFANASILLAAIGLIMRHTSPPTQLDRGFTPPSRRRRGRSDTCCSCCRGAHFDPVLCCHPGDACYEVEYCCYCSTDCARCCAGANCNTPDCKCDDTGLDAVGFMIVIAVVVIVIAAFLGLFYLFFIGLFHTITLQNQYTRKLLDRERSRSNALVVADLELVDTSGAPQVPLDRVTGGNRPRGSKMV